MKIKDKKKNHRAKSSKLSILRLNKEYNLLRASPVNKTFVLVDETNLYIWHFLIYGLDDLMYAGGYYYGKIIIPKGYPYYAPKIVFVTPTGCFPTNEELCFYLDETKLDTWNAEWVIGSLLQTVITELHDYKGDEDKCFQDINEQRQKCAQKSLSYNCQNKDFMNHFHPYFHKLGIIRERKQTSDSCSNDSALLDVLACLCECAANLFACE